MKISRRIRRSRFLITSGVELVVVCVLVFFVALFFDLVWLMETVAIVAILVALFTLFEYLSVRRVRLRRR